MGIASRWGLSKVLTDGPASFHLGGAVRWGMSSMRMRTPRWPKLYTLDGEYAVKYRKGE
jgi:hypothetical protein